MSLFNYTPDEKYRIKIQLDTNILSYLVDEFYKNLNDSILILKDIPFVDIQSNEYAYFELFGIRKKELYLREIYNSIATTGRTPNMSSLLKYHQGYNYDVCKYEADVQVRTETNINLELQNKLCVDFGIDFSNVFHSGLGEATKDLCLKTKLSSQDSLILVSSVFPDGVENQSVIFWSNDLDFCQQFDLVKDEIYTLAIFDNKVPRVEYLQKLKNGATGVRSEINLTTVTQNYTKEELEEFFIPYLKNRLLEITPNFFGKTFRYESERPKTVYFKLPPNTTIDIPNVYLTIIDKKLRHIINSKPITEFWLGGHPIPPENYPYSSEIEQELSFEWQFTHETTEEEEAEFNNWVHSNNHFIFINEYNT